MVQNAGDSHETGQAPEAGDRLFPTLDIPRTRTRVGERRGIGVSAA